jgi:uncharacterized protein (DUF1501 family)
MPLLAPLALAAGLPASLTGLTLAADPGATRTLVVVFLRGGADGLSIAPPLGDPDYRRLRPLLAIDRRDALPLDGFFGLHPLLSPLGRCWQDGQLALVHATGSDDSTRSHFQAQDLMEHGGATVAGGWLGRWLQAAAATEGPTGGLSALSLGPLLAESLRSAPTASVLQSLDDLGLGPDAAALRPALQDLYADDAQLGAAATQACAALDRLATLRGAPYRPAAGADYPADPFSQGLLLLARLIKAGVGLQAATIDLPGWDGHALQPTLIAPLLQSLGGGLAAFAADLGPLLATTSVVVMTEFGRRVGENSALGCDHGRGGACLVLGGGVAGGVHGRWPGLTDTALDGPGDLAVTTDYRDALAPVLLRHGPPAALAAAFPDRPGAALAL